MPLDYVEGPFPQSEFTVVIKFKSHCILKDIRSGWAKLFVNVNDDTTYKWGTKEYSRDSLKVRLMGELDDLKNFHYVEIPLREEDGTMFPCLFPLNDLENNTSIIKVAQPCTNLMAYFETKSIFHEST